MTASLAAIIFSSVMSLRNTRKMRSWKCSGMTCETLCLGMLKLTLRLDLWKNLMESTGFLSFMA